MRPFFRVIFAAISFGVTAYGWYLDTTTLPLAHEGAVIGKGIFLTYQTEIILTVYFFLELASSLLALTGMPNTSVDNFAHWVSPVAGGFGLFLTIMFYITCWFQESFQRDVVRKFEAQGIPMTYCLHVIHFPSCIFVLLDTLTKDPEVARAQVGSATSYFKWFFAFGAWYVFVLRWNYNTTHMHVYPFMNDFTADWQHWAFYAFCFGWIWVLGVVHRAIMMKVVGSAKQGRSLRPKTKTK